MPDISFLPPGLRGYVAGQQQNQASDAQTLQSLLGLLQAQHAMQQQPLQLENLRAQTALYNAQAQAAPLTAQSLLAERNATLAQRLMQMSAEQNKQAGQTQLSDLLNPPTRVDEQGNQFPISVALPSATPPSGVSYGGDWLKLTPQEQAAVQMIKSGQANAVLAPSQGQIQSAAVRAGANLNSLGLAQPPLTPYQSSSLAQRQTGLDIAQQRADQAGMNVTKPAYKVVPDEKSPTKFSYADLNDPTSMVAPAPAPSSTAKRDPRIEQMYHDYINQPQVKDANDLEAKMKPVADYMVDFKKTGKSVNVNDESLVKLYLSATTGSNRSYNVDRKALAALPNVGDRFGNAISSFATGHDLTDQTRTELFNYVVQRYKALDSARQSVKASTIARAKANMITPEQVFGAQ